MATGDSATSAGFPLVSALEDIRDSYDEINLTRDLIANHQLTGGHPFTAISGTASAAQIPGLDASKIVSGVLAAARIPVPTRLQFGANLFYESASAWLSNTAISALGNIESGGLLRGIESYNYNITSAGRRAAWIDSAGFIGHTASSERYKQDINVADIDPEAVLALEPLMFRYRQAVAELGDEAPVEIGLIAEQLHDAGLTAFVFYDADGKPEGVHYELWALAVHAAVRHVNERLNTLEERLAKLEGKK